ncbi:Holliday junction resolvase RuvX [Streptosporangium sp. DT93]|uniref:Holliday junction resolvase RuvX n=1 Tax=Streptosporangium sp. DT93 TaxID=3393428 RepID=UPI003CFB2288
MRNGVRLGVDVGSVRIGVARSDPSGSLATPVETVRRGRGDLDRLAEIAAEYEVVEVVVGLPTSLSGREGPAAEAARAFAGRISARLAPVPVRLFDERLTTVTAQQGLRASGVRAKNQRAVVDQAAAIVLLQAALDAERATGRPPGSPVTPPARGTGAGPARGPGGTGESSDGAPADGGAR